MGSMTFSITQNKYGQHDIFNYSKHILLPQKKNMSSYLIYIQIKSNFTTHMSHFISVSES